MLASLFQNLKNVAPPLTPYSLTQVVCHEMIIEQSIIANPSKSINLVQSKNLSIYIQDSDIYCGFLFQEIYFCYVFREHAQNTTNPAISLVVNNVNPLQFVHEQQPQ